MYVGYSKEHEALRDELRAYYDKLLTPEVEDQLRGSEGAGEAPRAIFKQMSADGWVGLGWPKEWGGKELGPMEQFVFFDESMRAGAPVPMLTINSVAPTIMRFGGRSSYATVRPFMIGLILGNLSAMVAWMIVGFFSGNQIPYWPA